jgi:hypothetical protein
LLSLPSLADEIVCDHRLYAAAKVEQLWNFNPPASRREMAWLFWKKKKRICADHHWPW